MVKPVSLSDNAYEVLSKMKAKDESFSDVVLRLAEGKRFNIDHFAGVWKDNPEWDEIAKTLERDRKRFKTRKVDFDALH